MGKKGIFISFEGGEGSGKTLQINNINQWLKENHIETVITREPGGSDGGEKIRSLLVSDNAVKWEPMSEAFLFCAARFEHIEKVIKPALSQGKWVLCDRFFDSMVAYQGYGHNIISLEVLNILNQVTLGSLKPDITFLLDLPVKAGLKRAFFRDESKTFKEDRFENMDIEFHERLRKGYLEIAQDNKDRFRILNAEKSIGEISDSLKKYLLPYIKQY